MRPVVHGNDRFDFCTRRRRKRVITQQMQKYVTITKESSSHVWRYVARDRAIAKNIARCFGITSKRVTLPAGR